MKDILFEPFGVAGINKIASADKKAALEAAEKLLDDEIERAAEAVLEKGEKIKVLLICGRSASGKTTFTKKLCERLCKKGRAAVQVSLDDFFLGAEHMPLNEDGTYDFENPVGIDLALAGRCFREIIEKGETKLPTFDFAKQRRGETMNTLVLPEKGLLVTEGIHSLAPELLKEIPEERIFRIFMEPCRDYIHEGRTVFTKDEIRLMRRMTRDELFRNWSAEKTLAQWKSVIAGEKLYIEPYIPFSDMKICTSFGPEPGIFLPVLEEMLSKIREDSPFFETAKEFLSRLSLFEVIEKDFLPKDSLLREFLG